MKCIKRDGRIKDYDVNYIKKAIGKALRETGKSDEEIECLSKQYSAQVNSIVKHLFKESVTVEQIQDIVEEVLKSEDKEVYKQYNNYRKARTEIRENKSLLFDKVKGILDGSNLEALNENANKKGYMSSTQRDLMAGEVSRAIARTMIPKDILEAHDKGAIKIHDMDYFINHMTNCDLINLDDMLQNGTVINNKMIEKPKSLRTAMTIATQISAQVASSQFGGQTLTLSHLAPFVREAKKKLYDRFSKYPIDKSKLEEIVNNELKIEIKDAVQTFNYQVNTLQTTNGQAPFQSVCMYVNEIPEYKYETALLIEEFLKQRAEGMKNKFGIPATQTFPKLLYFLDEDNAYEGSEFFYLTKLACISTSKTMNPDYMSVKKMKEVIGFAFPSMGCRSMLSPFKINGKYEFYGRGNVGVQTVCLPFVALESKRDNKDFFEVLDFYLDKCRRIGEMRYEKLKGVKACVSPILWQYGAISRLREDEEILPEIYRKGFTVSLGYTGLFETVKVLTGESHTTKEGHELALKIMQHLENKCLEWKEANPKHLWGVYGTPQESSTDFFSKAIQREFNVEGNDLFEKGFITNSYHVDVREPINAFDKFDFEATLQEYSKGGAISYCETYNMQKNPEALLTLIQHIYENIMYAEINFESDTCGLCHLKGVMEYRDGKWTCPQCGNNNINKMSVCRRVCGYLSDDGTWNEGRTKDIISRVKHL